MQSNDGRPPENPDAATLATRTAVVAPGRRARGLVIAVAAVAVIAVVLLLLT